MSDLEKTQEVPVLLDNGMLWKGAAPGALHVIYGTAAHGRPDVAITGSVYDHSADYAPAAALIPEPVYDVRRPLFVAALAYMTPESDKLAVLARLRQVYPGHTAEQLNQALKETCTRFAAAGLVPKVGP